MVNRLPIIGTFQSIGANREKIIGILLMELFSYGVIGTTLDLMIATPLLPFIGDLFNQYKDFVVPMEVQYNLVYGVAAASYR